MAEAKEKDLDLKSQELTSVASGDQNKLTGINVAAGRIQWQKYGEKKGDEGYIFKKNHGFAFKVDDTRLDQYKITKEALLDCIEQLEAMGPAEELKKTMGIRDQQGPANKGLVITSKVDPRIKMTATPVSASTADNDYDDEDFWVGWYLDDENLSHEMGVQNPKYEPQRDVAPEELKVVERAQEAAPVVNQTKQESKALSPEEELLGLTDEFTIDQVEYLRTNKKEYLAESKIPLMETGEADQDYDHATYDAICDALKAKGYQCTHREFNKYQGVYLTIKKGGKNLGKWWTVDSYVTGNRKPPKSEYKNSALVDQEGNEFSGNPGDYWNASDNAFDGLTLVLTKHDGSKVEIPNPKKSDLKDYDNTIEFEGHPDEVLVLATEDMGEGDGAHVRVSKNNKVDLGELLDLLGGSAKGESKEGDKKMSEDNKTLAEDYDRVDFWGLPKNLSEEGGEGTLMNPSSSKKPPEVGTKYGEGPAKKPVYQKDVKQYDKELDSKAATLSTKEDKPIPMQAGSAIEKPHTTVGTEYDEKPGKESTQLGDVTKDAIGDVVQGKGTSSTQQTEPPKAKIKVGAVDSTPKVMGEDEVPPLSPEIAPAATPAAADIAAPAPPPVEKKKVDMEAYMRGYSEAMECIMKEWKGGKKGIAEMDKMMLDPDKKKAIDGKGASYMEGYMEAMGNMKAKVEACDDYSAKAPGEEMPKEPKEPKETTKEAKEGDNDEMDDDEKKAMQASKSQMEAGKKPEIPKWAKKKR
jgi:hypothetical protein